MKKLLIFIIILLLVVIAVLCAIIYHQNSYNTNTNATTNSNTIDIDESNSNNNVDHMLDGPGSINESYNNLSFEEWEKLAKDFWSKNYGEDDVKATCYYDEDGIFVLNISNEHEVLAEYEVDEHNVASDRFSNTCIDFISGEFIPLDATTGIDGVANSINFTDNECIAIGYVTEINEVQFIDKYFDDPLTYGGLQYFDFRYLDNRTSGYGNKFVIIPKNKDVEITVYDCYLGDDNEMHIDNTLISSINEPFILLDDYIEYIPNMMVKFKYNGFEEMFPITFSGENGNLVLTGYEMEVKDISLY